MLTLNLSAFRETAAKGKEDLHKDAESPGTKEATKPLEIFRDPLQQNLYQLLQ
jgi:hypothetical protein